METFAERLRAAMAGPPSVKQVDIARACGIKPPSVSDWLNGVSVNIQGKNLLAAAKLLNVRPEWLAKGIGPMRPAAHMELDTPPNRFAAAPLELTYKETELIRQYRSMDEIQRTAISLVIQGMTCQGEQLKTSAQAPAQESSGAK